MMSRFAQVRVPIKRRFSCLAQAAQATLSMEIKGWKNEMVVNRRE